MARIDIFLTDNQTSLIVENKIHAQDGDEQIQRYVQAIVSAENKRWRPQDIVVIYLSREGADPPQASLGHYNIDEHEQYSKVLRQRDTGDIHCLYRAIHYNDDIRPWISGALTEVANITNLNVALTQYLEVIDMLYNRYKEKTMSLASYLKRNGTWNLDELRDLNVLSSAFPVVKKALISELMSTSGRILTNELEGEHDWSAYLDEDSNVLSVSHRGLKAMKYMQAFDEKGPYLTFTTYDFEQHSEQLQRAKEALNSNDALRGLANQQNLYINNNAEIFWKRTEGGANLDLFEFALNHNIEGAAEQIAANFYDFFKGTKPIFDELLKRELLV